jgi:glycerophosphoryl diester phosphodiesterase
VSSFDHAALAAARSAVPGLLIAPERLPEHGRQPAGVTVSQALALGAPVIQHRWETIHREGVEALHDAGVGVWAWNTNDPESVASVRAAGVDGAVSDDVGVLLADRRPSA